MAKIQKKGKVLYVPYEFNLEIKNIMAEDGIHSKAEAMKKAADYSLLGREAKKAGIEPKLPRVNFTNDFKRNKKKGMSFEDWL